MRGDSLRDLYAKTLAVLGLGLIAGAGAIVDYWPVGNSLPQIAHHVNPLPVPTALAQNLNQQIPAPHPRAASVVRVARQALLPGSVRWPAFAPKPASPARKTSAVPAPPAVTEEPPVADIPDVTAPVHAWTPELLQASQFETADPPPLNGGLFTPATRAIGGALKTTKESLVKAGVVTGASIADAFRGVLGAFKKVTPF